MPQPLCTEDSLSPFVPDQQPNSGCSGLGCKGDESNESVLRLNLGVLLVRELLVRGVLQELQKLSGFIERTEADSQHDLARTVPLGREGDRTWFDHHEILYLAR